MGQEFWSLKHLALDVGWAAIIWRLSWGWRIHFQHGSHTVALMLTVSWEPSWCFLQAYLSWPLRCDILGIDRFLIWHLAPPRAIVPRWQGRSFAFYWPNIISHIVSLCHTLLVKAVTSSPRCKRRGPRPYLLMGGVPESLRPCLKASTDIISDASGTGQVKK